MSVQVSSNRKSRVSTHRSIRIQFQSAAAESPQKSRAFGHTRHQAFGRKTNDIIGFYRKPGRFLIRAHGARTAEDGTSGQTRDSSLPGVAGCQDTSLLFFPRQTGFPEMPVIRGLPVNRPQQVETLDNRGRPEIDLFYIFGRSKLIACSEGINLHG